jgi:hypothetical protein
VLEVKFTLGDGLGWDNMAGDMACKSVCNTYLDVVGMETRHVVRHFGGRCR